MAQITMTFTVYTDDHITEGVLGATTRGRVVDDATGTIIAVTYQPMDDDEIRFGMFESSVVSDLIRAAVNQAVNNA